MDILDYQYLNMDIIRVYQQISRPIRVQMHTGSKLRYDDRQFHAGISLYHELKLSLQYYISIRDIIATLPQG